MQDVSNLRQVLVQTQVVQRTQENARRRGEIQQQAIAKKLDDRVDIQGRHVEESPDAAEARVDPDAEREKERRQAPDQAAEGWDAEEEHQRDDGDKEPPDAQPTSEQPARKREKPLEDDSEKGSVIDLRA